MSGLTKFVIFLCGTGWIQTVQASARCDQHLLARRVLLTLTALTCAPAVPAQAAPGDQILKCMGRGTAGELVLMKITVNAANGDFDIGRETSGSVAIVGQRTDPITGDRLDLLGSVARPLEFKKVRLIQTGIREVTVWNEVPADGYLFVSPTRTSDHRAEIKAAGGDGPRRAMSLRTKCDFENIRTAEDDWSWTKLQYLYRDWPYSCDCAPMSVRICNPRQLTLPACA